MKGSNVGKNQVEAIAKASASNGVGNVSVNNASTAVAAASSTRKAIMLFNDSNETIYVSYGVAAQMNKGGRLNANGGYIREEIFKGAINAICASGGKNLTFIII